MDFIVLDELGYLAFAQSGGQLLFHLVSRLYPALNLAGLRDCQITPIEYLEHSFRGDRPGVLV